MKIAVFPYIGRRRRIADRVGSTPSVLGAIVRSGLLFLGCCLASGCALTDGPISIDGNFEKSPPAEIQILPVIDARQVRSDHVLVSRNVRDTTVEFLKAKNYRVAVERGDAPDAPGDLNDLEPEALAALVAGRVGPVLLLQVDRMTREREELGVTYTVKLSGFLLDAPTSKILWRDSATGESSLNGLLSVLSRGSGEYEAAMNAARRLVASMPARSAGAVGSGR
jgi:hypothetical protein